MTAHEPAVAAGKCGRCGAPIDSRYFDESGFASVQNVAPGARLVLARFELPRRFCGLLDYFAQFTDQFALSPERVETPDIEWSLALNGHPLAPYGSITGILNPWGSGTYQIAIRLDDNAVLEFVVRVIGAPPVGLGRIGGRIMGRYWYNDACADAARYRT